ncbi:MAG: phenylalanine--tRNA ligase subunit beta, partial [Candidatus Omnitrophica bacterium]|nr:phenylalanine--tRNA ligase subunit beta [Candidatus Omnitrophota bacterium]
MKISLNWLKNYISFSTGLDDFVHKLTMAGIEVEAVHDCHGDKVVEVEVTPNRSDCLNMIGIAREVSAILNKTKKIPSIKKLPLPKTKCDVQIVEKDKCSRYIGTVIEGVSVKKTPDTIRKRIEALGLRSINNVVDITNFSLLENGQPLHAFDYDKLIGGKIVVRFAKKGEKIVTIDGVERELDPSVLVIADEKRPVAIAGIMGGQDTEVTSSTKNILLESACFDQVLIRRTSRKLALSSDSSYRFERGVDFDGVEYGSRRATDLILQTAGGKMTSYSNLIGKKSRKLQTTVNISIDEINSYLGAKLTTAKCKTILDKLDFKVSSTKGGMFKITPPSFRTDIKAGVDVVEEVSRIIGYDNLPMTMPEVKATDITTSNRQICRKRIAQTMVMQGVNEIVTYSMINQAALEKSRQGHLKGIKISNPLTLDQEKMRPAMLPSLLSVVQFNLNKGQKNLKLFEIGKVYTGNKEKDVLAAVMTGDSDKDWRETMARARDFFDLKGCVEQVLSKLGFNSVLFEQDTQEYFEDGAAVIKVKSQSIGFIGEVHEDVLENWGIKQQKVWFAQIDLDVLYSGAAFEKRFQPISGYPAVVRDISLAVKNSVSFQQIKDIVYELGGKLLTNISLTEEYIGEKIPEGQRGLVFSLQYQSVERTLTEDEVNI